jgi:hypothetical protein
VSSATRSIAKNTAAFYVRVPVPSAGAPRNTMITMVPHDSDWNAIAELTGTSRGARVSRSR